MDKRSPNGEVFAVLALIAIVIWGAVAVFQSYSIAVTVSQVAADKPTIFEEARP